MAGYTPLYIKGNETGLVQSRQEFILPDDAYPVLENAFIWRERIKRKKGFQLLGRLRRVLTLQALPNTSGGTVTYTYNTLFSSITPAVGASEPNKQIQPGSLVITIGAPDTATFTDDGLGGFTVTGVGVALGSSVNYTTGVVTIVLSAAVGGATVRAAFNYYPCLPVMGLRSRELNDINKEQTIAFDQKYAYDLGVTGWEEFLPATIPPDTNIWTGTNSDFFWSTNYWVGDGNKKIFWVTNFSGPAGDPIRYTNGTAGTKWVDFAPTINAGGDKLQQCLAMLPFRGRMVTFNTWEGATLAGSVNYRQRIRWAAIGNPFTDVSAIVTTVSPDAWKDDIRGKGGFLDIPTAEDIVAVGFVRDNCVIYCERSTWQLRYTGRSIAPFQIERVNSELGAESTFSAVQFDTSLVGIGDKGVVECDSYKSERIDIKIPDLVFNFDNINEGPKRVHGIRDFYQKLAYWTYPLSQTKAIFPNRRLVYNYENDSWAIFTDSLTCLGNYQPQEARTWETTTIPWQEANFTWVDRPPLIPTIVGGNQQGFVEILDQQVTNEVSLTIHNITGNSTTSPTSIKSVSHNLETGTVIKIQNLLSTDPFYASLNNKIFSVVVTDADNFTLYKYDPTTQKFSLGQYDSPGTYVGGGQISIRDNFSIVSKKFNFLDDGQNIQLGFIDILMDTTSNGAISLYVYVDYNDSTPVNILDQNQMANSQPDTFFNSVIETNTVSGLETSKNWIRAFCPARGAFITIEYTLSPAQMNSVEQENDVQIDAQILWMRRSGRQLPVGV